MTNDKIFSWRERFQSFGFAFSGFKLFFRTEHNAWLHAAATLAVIILSVVTGLSGIEWIAIVFAVALVWITEMFNTAIEKTMDHLSPGLHQTVKLIKDVSSAAVLAAAFAALIVGLIIFIPKIL